MVEGELDGAVRAGGEVGVTATWAVQDAFGVTV